MATFHDFYAWGARAAWRVRAIAVLGAVGLTLLAGDPVRAQTIARENEVKATLLFNFCHFVEWPDLALADLSVPFVIGILGRDPFGKFLDDLVAQEKAHGRAIVVRRFTRLEEVTPVHLLYISLSERRVRSVFLALRGRPLLIIGEADSPGFLEAGGMIAFALQRGNIKLLINIDEARRAGLTISAKLLRLAEVTRTQN